MPLGRLAHHNRDAFCSNDPLVVTSTGSGQAVSVIGFDTAWSPPLGWLEALIGAHPGVRARLAWSEPDNDEVGEVSLPALTGAAAA